MQTQLSRVLKPIGEASGLPNAHYIDDATFEMEKERLFFANWSAVAFAHDVPEIADAVPISFLDQPLLLVRDRQGQVRVFQNTCRHRGMILVAEPRKMRGVIRCPYHSWCYDLNGDLKTTPHVGGAGHNVHESIDRDALGLVEIRSHIWQGIVFVNINGKARDFDEAAAPLIKRWREFDRDDYFGGADSTFELTVESNWKLAVENFCESYHLPWIHPGLNAYSKLEDHYHIAEPGEYSGQGTTVYNPDLSPDQSFPDYEGLSPQWDTQAEYVSFFPNVLLGVHRDHRYAIILTPQGKSRTVERVALFYATREATGETFADLRAKNAALWKEVFEEDIFVVEGMQKGRHGAAFDGGKFSPVMDEPTWLFHQWVARKFVDPTPA